MPLLGIRIDLDAMDQGKATDLLSALGVYDKEKKVVHAPANCGSKRAWVDAGVKIAGDAGIPAIVATTSTLKALMPKPPKAKAAEPASPPPPPAAPPVAAPAPAAVAPAGGPLPPPSA